MIIQLLHTRSMTGSQWATPIGWQKVGGAQKHAGAKLLLYYPELLCCRDEGWPIVEYGHIFAERTGVYNNFHNG